MEIGAKEVNCVVVFAMPFDSIASEIKICGTASGRHHAYEAMISRRALRGAEQIPMTRLERCSTETALRCYYQAVEKSEEPEAGSSPCCMIQTEYRVEADATLDELQTWSDCEMFPSKSHSHLSSHTT
jgi:hypothetical protein